MNTYTKMLAALLAALLCLAGAALAEEAGGTPVTAFIDEGGFVIQIPDENGDLGWIADDMAQDDSVVKLFIADLIEDTFVVRYEPVGDGEVTVGVRHYIGIACDEAFTWDLKVMDGAVRENTGGSYAVSPDEAEQDPYLSGEWLEGETQFTRMTVSKGMERGWDVVIVSPMTHGAYVFKTTFYYDCDLHCFVYDKGKFWDLPADYEEGASLGEARDAGTCGTFTFTGDDQDLWLTWYDDLTGEEIAFQPAGD